jgi:hypothetical protein
MIRSDTTKHESAKPLADVYRWKHRGHWHGEGFYVLRTEDTRDVPVRLFLTHANLPKTSSIAGYARHQVRLVTSYFFI